MLLVLADCRQHSAFITRLARCSIAARSPSERQLGWRVDRFIYAVPLRGAADAKLT